MRWAALVGAAVSLAYGVGIGWANLTDGFLTALLIGLRATGLSLTHFLVAGLVAASLRWAATAAFRAMRSARGPTA